MGFRDNRQSKRMLEKMGLNLEEMPNVEEVIIDVHTAKGDSQPIIVHSKSQKSKTDDKTTAA